MIPHAHTFMIVFSTMVAHDFWYGHFRFGYCMLMLHVVPTMFEEIESMNGLFICLSFFAFEVGYPLKIVQLCVSVWIPSLVPLTKLFL
jgi:hypothetical protein